MKRFVLTNGGLHIVLGLWIFISSSEAWPARATDDTAKDLASQVTIRRDRFGVPHILANTEEAAAFGHGYSTAEDHIGVLARLFLKARSEEAAYFGEKFVKSDFETKQFHMYEGAQTGYSQLAPWVRAIIDGYAAGYNHYVQKHRAELPEWVKTITPVDLLAHGRRVVLREFSWDRSLGKLEKIGRKAARELPEDGPAFQRGSNMWAIGKGRSHSGKGLLLGNPHLTWEGSQLFCEAHITVLGKIDVYGTTLVGSPVVTIGFNESLGWSHTVNVQQWDDIYELTLDPKEPGHYLYDGRSLPLRKETVEIKVKTANGLESRTKELYWSHHGPVLRMNGDKAYAFKSASMDESRMIEQWNLMGKARTLEEFRQVLDMQALPMFNICYADKEGNDFYLFNGRVPDRPAGYKWDGIVPGNTSATDWKQILPESRLPFLLNPAGGYVQNCNSAPWYTNLQAPIDQHKYPEELTPNFNSLRTQLSLEMLEGDKDISLEKILHYKFNTKLLLADRVKEDLVRAIRGQTVDGVSLNEAADVLEAWDNKAAHESKGALLFANFWFKYGQKTEHPYSVPWDESKPASTPAGLGDPDTARSVMAATIKKMKEKYGTIAVKWGDVHRLRRGKIDVPMSGFISEYRQSTARGRSRPNFRGAAFGDFGSFRVIDYEEQKDGQFVAFRGDSFVMAVEFTSPPTAYTVVAYSQSDDPNSPHHTDQSVLFAEEKWKRVSFTQDEIAKNLERSYQP
jgi:acyl-homoserine-lactone acylase